MLFPSLRLLNGQWDWLVTFDGNVVLDLLRVGRLANMKHWYHWSCVPASLSGPFLEKYSLKPLLLLDWSYHESCGEDGFNCFSHELKSMLSNRQQYIEEALHAVALRPRAFFTKQQDALKDSRENIVAWEKKLTKEHDGGNPQP